MRFRSLHAFWIMLCLAALEANRADACECATDVVEIVSPSADEIVDPFRPVIATGRALSGPPQVVSSTSVEATVLALVGGDYLIIARPVEAMPEGAVQLEIVNELGTLASTQFTVDSNAAEAQGASIPSIVGVSMFHDFSSTQICGAEYLVYQLAVEALGAVAFLQDVGVAADDADPLAGSSLSLGLVAGNSDGCQFNWPDAAYSSSIVTRVLAIGADGNITDFSEPFTVVTPTDGDCDGLADEYDACPTEAGASPSGCPADGVSPWACDDDPTKTCAPNGRVCEASGEGEGEGDGSQAPGEGCSTSSSVGVIALLAILGGRKRRAAARSMHRWRVRRLP